MKITRKTRVFISYSRKDKRFARKLKSVLETGEIDAWVDWEDIPHASDWMAEIAASIKASDAFIFVMSPDSLRSEVCARELDMAITENKKIIPVLYREPEKRQRMHPKLASTNWVQMRPKKENFGEALAQLMNTIKTDLGWVSMHTHILQRASEWERKNRGRIHLLQGSDLTDAERWMADSTLHEGREVTPLQAEYIAASRKDALRRQRNLTVGVALTTVFSLLLVVFAVFQWNQALKNERLARESAAIAEASEQVALLRQAEAEQSAQLARDKENEAKAQRSAALANAYKERPGELATSTLLALESMKRFPSHEAEDVLRHNLSQMPVPLAQLKQGGRIWNVELSPDGQYLVAASADGSACVWTIRGESKFCVRHESDVTDALITGDNSLLITAGLDGYLRLWNFEDGSLLKFFNFGSAVLDIDLNRRNTLLAAGREDGLISVIDLERRKDVYFYDFASGPLSVVKFQPNGEWLGIATKKGITRIWKVFSGTPEKGPQHRAEIFKLVFSPDGKLMVSVGEDSVARISRAETGRQTHVLEHNDWVEDAAFSPDSQWFATASDDNLVRVFDANRGVEKLRMSHGSFVQRVLVSPDGNWIASTGYDFSARIWNAQTGAMMLEASLDGIGSALAFSPDGKRLIVGDRSGNVTIWDISSLDARLGYIQFTEFVNQAKFDPAGRWMLINTDDKILWQIPADQLTSIHDGTLGTNLLTFEDLTAQMKISPNSQWVALSENSEIGRSGAVLFNLETKVTHFLPHSSDITALAISPDGRFLATTNENNTQVQIWNIASGEPAAAIPFEEIVFASAYSPRDPILAIGLSDKVVLWNTSTNSPAAALRHVGEIASLDFNSAGNWLATTSSDGSVYVWDMDQGNFIKPKYEFQQGGRITSLDFNPQKHWLASAGLDGFVYIWDLDTGQELVRIPHGGAVSGISFSPDGSLLATVSRKTVQFWDLDLLRLTATQDLEAAACARLVRNLSLSQWEFFFKQDEYEILCENLP